MQYLCWEFLSIAKIKCSHSSSDGKKSKDKLSKTHWLVKMFHPLCHDDTTEGRPGLGVLSVASRVPPTLWRRCDPPSPEEGGHPGQETKLHCPAPQEKGCTGPPHMPHALRDSVPHLAEWKGVPTDRLKEMHSPLLSMYLMRGAVMCSFSSITDTAPWLWSWGEQGWAHSSPSSQKCQHRADTAVGVLGGTALLCGMGKQEALGAPAAVHARSCRGHRAEASGLLHSQGMWGKQAAAFGSVLLSMRISNHAEDNKR